MTHKKTSKSKIFTLLFSLMMCFAFIPSIAMASPTNTVYAEGGTGTTGGLTIGGESDMLGVWVYCIFFKGKKEKSTVWYWRFLARKRKQARRISFVSASIARPTAFQCS